MKKTIKNPSLAKVAKPKLGISAKIKTRTGGKRIRRAAPKIITSKAGARHFVPNIPQQVGGGQLNIPQV